MCLPHNFYPRSPCGERLQRRGRQFHPGLISIHALLAESDGMVQGIPQITGISIHALLAESDFAVLSVAAASSTFLSTLSLRRATEDYEASARAEFISIHALLAESDLLSVIGTATRPKFLSTLSLRRATVISAETPSILSPFLSTLSLRRATRAGRADKSTASISIHALLAESDLCS